MIGVAKINARWQIKNVFDVWLEKKYDRLPIRKRKNSDANKRTVLRKRKEKKLRWSYCGDSEHAHKCVMAHSIVCAEFKNKMRARAALVARALASA